MREGDMLMNFRLGSRETVRISGVPLVKARGGKRVCQTRLPRRLLRDASLRKGREKKLTIILGWDCHAHSIAPGLCETSISLAAA